MYLTEMAVCDTGMACGQCGQKDAPEPACGDQREGGAPYFWVNAHHDLQSGQLAQSAQLLANVYHRYAEAGVTAGQAGAAGKHSRIDSGDPVDSPEFA